MLGKIRISLGLKTIVDVMCWVMSWSDYAVFITRFGSLSSVEEAGISAILS